MGIFIYVEYFGSAIINVLINLCMRVNKNGWQIVKYIDY